MKATELVNETAKAIRDETGVHPELPIVAKDLARRLIEAEARIAEQDKVIGRLRQISMVGGGI